MQRVNTMRIVNATECRYTLGFGHGRIDLWEPWCCVFSYQDLIHVPGHCIDVLGGDQAGEFEETLILEGAVVCRAQDVSRTVVEWVTAGNGAENLPSTESCTC